MNLPEQIVSFNFDIIEGKVYTAFLYQYTNLDNNKKYIGIHKGTILDGYWHSSTCKKFHSVTSNCESKLDYTILDYGDYDQMKNSEHEILSSVDAINNEMYYNKSNGSPAFPEVNVNNCMNFVAKYKEGAYNVPDEDVNLHVDMDRYQTRTKDDDAQQKYIKQSVDEQLGSTKLCDPILVWENVNKGTDRTPDQRINGNHTVFGVKDSKHGNTLPVARVPESVWKEEYKFSELDKQFIARLLNSKTKKRRVTNSDDDIIKGLIDSFYDHNIPIDSKTNELQLAALNYNKSERDKFINAAKKRISKDKLRSSNLVWCNYKAHPFKSSLDAQVEDCRNDKTISFSASSGMSDKVLADIFRHFEQLQKKHNMVVVIYHPNEKYEESWKSKEQPGLIKVLKFYNKETKRNVRFYEMPTTTSDGSST